MESGGQAFFALKYPTNKKASNQAEEAPGHQAADVRQGQRLGQVQGQQPQGRRVRLQGGVRQGGGARDRARARARADDDQGAPGQP